MDNQEQMVWFAMRVTYRRELDVKRLLDKLSIESFIPMRYEIRIRNKKKERKLVPVIHNLIFVHTTPSIIKSVKSQIQHLQYLIQKDRLKRTPIIVPDKEMQQFIAITSAYDEQLIYLKPEEINLKRGTKVRIHGGIFDGMEGVFIKLAGTRNKRVIISIQDVIAVAAVSICPDLIEVIS